MKFSESGGHRGARILVVAHFGDSVHAVRTVPYRYRILATLIIPDDQCYCMVIGTYLTTTQKKLIFFLSLAHLFSLWFGEIGTAPYSNRQFMRAKVNKQEVPRRVTSPRLSIDKHAETATILLLTEFNNKLDLTSEKKRVKIIQNCFW